MTPFIEPVFFPHLGQIRIVRMGREIVLDVLQARPGLLLLRRPQGRDIVRFFDLVDARFEVHALLRQAIQIGRGQYGIGLRHAPVVGFLARIEHVVIGGDIVAPIVQIAAHEIELAVVLQTLLEFIARQQRVQIARLGRVRQIGELPIPGQRVFLVVVQQAIEQLAAANAFDRVVDLLEFIVERLDCRVVVTPQPDPVPGAEHRRRAR